MLGDAEQRFGRAAAEIVKIVLGNQGGGGVVVLASAASVAVTSSGVVRSAGGAGSDSTDDGVTYGAGGGGGGGLIRLIAPSVSSQGTVDVGGGPLGQEHNELPPSWLSYYGGQGGGASVGSGGIGSTVTPAGISGAMAGSAGMVLLDDGVDPSALFY